MVGLRGWAAAALVAALPAVGWCDSIPAVDLKLELLNSGPIHVGDTVTVQVSGLVTNNPSQLGIGLYDLDALITDTSGLHATSYTVMDTLGVNGGTTIDPTKGVLDIDGGFVESDVGVTDYAPLFTVDLHADAAGPNGLSIGEGSLFGFAFGLSDGLTTLDTAGATIDINVEPSPTVPEPATLSLLGVGGAALLMRRRR